MNKEANQRAEAKMREPNGGKREVAKSAEKAFLALLNSALTGNECDTALIGAAQTALGNSFWHSVLQLAREQNVLGLTSDAILHLPTPFLPPKETLFKLMVFQEKLSKVHDKQTEVLLELLRLYRSKGWNVVLLKGLANAQLYPKPKLHAPGDIDILFLDLQQYQESLAWVQEQKLGVINEALYELAFASPFRSTA